MTKVKNVHEPGSKIARILDYLDSGYTINQADAIAMFNCYRLAPVIHRLRGEGFFIDSQYKGPSKFAHYWLAGWVKRGTAKNASS